MSSDRVLRQRMEALWWLFTAVLAVSVMAPIILNRVTYPYYFTNALYIVVFITVSRYIFLLRHTWIARRFWVKIVLIALSALAVFMFVTSLSDFNNFVEEVGLQELVAHLPAKRQYSLIKYIQREVIFFGVGSIIALVVLPIRLMISIWRLRNTPNRI